jgi:hypothetical protein
MAETMPADGSSRPAEAALATVLFSSWVNSPRSSRRFRNPQNIMNARITDCERHADAPADLHADVDVGDRHDAAEEGAGDDRPNRQLWFIRLVVSL